MIVFRADGNSLIGLGHIMRNLSIADSFRDKGERCCFFLADDGVSGLIIGRGHSVKVLNSRFDNMDAELEALQNAICIEKDVSVLVVDSYYVTSSYLSALHLFCSSRGIILAYIDDVLSFPYPCDVLINYNIYACVEDYKKIYKGFSEPVLLLGTAFTPLRLEFQHVTNRIIRQKATDIFVSTGGADPEHMGLALVNAIKSNKNWNAVQFHFIIGLLNADRRRIESIAEKTNNIQLHINVSQMAKLMCSCDVALSAAGSTMYELCATKTPTLTYIVADNQILGAEGFEKKGILYSAGDIRVIGIRELSKRILLNAIDLLNDYEKRCKIAEQMGIVVDGYGARRIVEYLISLTENLSGNRDFL